MKLDERRPSDLEKSGELEAVENWLWQDFNRTREMETHSVNEFEKVLWLTNSGAATITIGYITTSNTPNILLFLGSCMFVIAVIALLVMKFIGETNASRDRVRRQNISEKFFKENRPMSTFYEIRDNKFMALAKAYKGLKSSAAILFVVGCVLTLSSVYPQANSNVIHNKQLNIDTAKSVVQEIST